MHTIFDQWDRAARTRLLITKHGNDYTVDLQNDQGVVLQLGMEHGDGKRLAAALDPTAGGHIEALAREQQGNADLRQENARQRAVLAKHVPCQACAWPHPRPPENDEEPPIVRGALDAQEAAEREIARLRAAAAEVGSSEGPIEAAPKGGTPEPCSHPYTALQVNAATFAWACGACGSDLMPLPPGFDIAAWARSGAPLAAAPEPQAAPLPEPDQAGQRLVRYESLDQPPPTGLYVMDYGETGGNPRYEVRFAFEGETCFDETPEAMAALAEYEAVLRLSLAPAAAAPLPESGETMRKARERQAREDAHRESLAAGRPHHLAWNGIEWADERCGCRYHPDDDNGSHGGAPHVHRCERHAPAAAAPQGAGPVPMVLHCPECRARHIDEGDFASKPHHTHACQSCGLTWRPAVVPTVGVRFLPGFKNEPFAAPSAPQGGPAGLLLEDALGLLRRARPTVSADVALDIEKLLAAASPPHGGRPEPECGCCNTKNPPCGCCPCAVHDDEPAPAYVPNVGDPVVVTLRGKVDSVGGGLVEVEAARDHGWSGPAMALWVPRESLRPTSDEPGEVG